LRSKSLIDHGAEVGVAANATQEYIEKIKEAIASGDSDTEPHKNGVTSLMVAALGGTRRW